MNAVDGVNLCGAYMRVLEVANVSNWAERERHWIAHGRSNGWDLFNLTEGGMAFMDWLSLQNTRRRFVNHSRRARCPPAICGAEFWRKPSAIAAGEAKFCSRACYQEWQKGKPKAIPKAEFLGTGAARGLKPNARK